MLSIPRTEIVFSAGLDCKATIWDPVRGTKIGELLQGGAPRDWKFPGKECFSIYRQKSEQRVEKIFAAGKDNQTVTVINQDKILSDQGDTAPSFKTSRNEKTSYPSPLTPRQVRRKQILVQRRKFSRSVSMHRSNSIESE